MPLWGNKDQSNSAPLFVANPDYVSGGAKVNCQMIFANTTPNVVHANLTAGVWGVDGTIKLQAAPIDVPGAANTGAPAWKINDYINFIQTGAVTSVNADAHVIGLGVANIIGIQIAGIGYNLGDHVQVLGPANTATAIANVTGNNSGAITQLTLLSDGNYTANFASTSNIAISAVTGAGVGGTVNVIVGIATLAINNSGAYTTLPASANNVVITGGSGIGATANLTFNTNNQKVGGAGFVLKTVQDGGQVQYEILVASGSITGTGQVDTGGLL